MKLHDVFYGDTSNILIQLFRYTLVGGAAFVVDFGLLYVLTDFLNVHYLVSATVSFIAGLLCNYLLSTCWIFRHSKLNNKLAEFLFYSLIGVVGLLLNDLFIYLFTEHLHLHYLLSKIITAVLVMLWNFLGRRFCLFK